MKKLMILALAVLALVSCNQNGKKENAEQQKHSAVAYFSATGTTQAVAELLAQAADADLIAIEPEEAYTDADLDWHDSLSRSSVEMRDPEARPVMKAIEADFTPYDTIYLGFPIWWGVAPRIINTFIETANLQGKVIRTFATSGTSDIDGAAEALALAYPELQWETSRLLNDTNFEELCDWAQGK